MEKGLITLAKLTAIANAIRSKNGEAAQYSPDTMAAKIGELRKLPALEQAAAAADIASGKEALDDTGTVTTGTMPDMTGDDLSVQLDAGSGRVGAVAFFEGTPKRFASTVSSAITLPAAGGSTVTPTAAEQTAVAARTWVTGDVKVAGDANLAAENIKNGVSIFGVAGAYSGSTPTMQEKTAVQNGTVTPDEGYAGLSSVTVSVPGGETQRFSDEAGVMIGSFTPAADLTAGYRIDYTQDSAPYLIALWTTNPALSGDNTNLAYRLGGFYLYVPGVTQHRSDGGIVASSGQPVLTSGVNLAYQRIYPQSGQIIIGSSDAYPLKAGIEYKWMARWLA